MKKITGLGLFLAVIGGSAMAAGVSGIAEDGKSASGKTIYKVTCCDESAFGSIGQVANGTTL